MGTEERRFSSLGQATRRLWAKSAGDQGHGLLAHMSDVAAVAQALLERESGVILDRIAERAGWAGAGRDTLMRWLPWLAGQHDLGKATIGFQAKWPQGQMNVEAAGLPFPARLKTADRHDLSSALLLTRRVGSLLAGALGAHHGFHFEARELANARLVGEPPAWAQARQELLQAYDEALGVDADQIAVMRTCAADLEMLNWLAGLTSVADWIGSSVEWFPPGERAETVAGHIRQARERADRALDLLGWPVFKALQAPEDLAQCLSRMTGRAGLAPRPLQQAADELLQGCHAPVLMIVEAPMGEGKTELAFLSHLRLQAAVGHRGLYVGLPTQATGNAMFDRTRTFLEAFGSGQRLDLQLAHGAAALDERLVALRGIHAGDAGGHPDVRCSEWFSQRRRALLSPCGVGTVDQALYATLNVRHHFVRLWGLANRLVVLDEIHAYDSYTGGLIEALLRWLQALGCSVILMSATLPRARRESLLRAWAPRLQQEVLPDERYPRVTRLCADRIDVRHCPSRPQVPIELAGIAEEVESLADVVDAQIRRGPGCIAVIVNTVDRAQRLHELLKPRLPVDLPVVLFHARFPSDERAAREREVLALFGGHGDGRRPSRALLIATQVAEQSLDIDFDLLVSDLAPVDLLLQRAGRLHRHERARPEIHAQPRLVVAGLLAASLPDLDSTGWAAVYDSYLLGRTWAFTSRESRWTLPQDIDRQVQRVYGDEDLPAGLDAASRDFIEGEAWGGHLEENRLMAQFALNAAIDARADPAEAYAGKPHGREAGEGLGADNRTRFGADSLTLVPVHQDGGLWRLHPDGPAFDPAAMPDEGLARQLLGRQVRLSRKAVVRALQGADVPAGWRDHPWLRDLRVLPLQAGSWRHGSLLVRLDPVLGVVYDRAAGAVPSPTSEETSP